MVAIIDYKAGNLTSVRLALESLGQNALVTSDPREIESAERLIFPGVGAAASAMDNLRSLGLDRVIKESIGAGKPFLGICLGTQILFGYSEEGGHTPVLGVLDGSVRRFSFEDPSVKIPHMGWNQIRFAKRHPVFEGVADGEDFYFVHSYYTSPDRDGDILAKTEYSCMEFASAVARDNLVATQFHIEKSGRTGLKVLKNFLSWDGKPC